MVEFVNDLYRICQFFLSNQQLLTDRHDAYACGSSIFDFDCLQIASKELLVRNHRTDPATTYIDLNKVEDELLLLINPILQSIWEKLVVDILFSHVFGQVDWHLSFWE